MFRTCILAVWACAAAWSHDVITTNLTYSRDISRIFAARCLSCHNSGNSIPLTNYEQVRPWAVSIKEQVISRAMPPWGAVKGFGELQPDFGLTQEEIMIVAGWVIGGVPQGDLKLLPAAAARTPGKPAPMLRDVLTIDTRTTLRQALKVAAIRPLPQSRVASARLTATLPDGRVTPLLWLYEFDPAWNRTFHLRNSLALPAGTIIDSSVPLTFALEAP